MFEWLTRWITRPMYHIYELGKLAGRAELKLEILRSQAPGGATVKADKPATKQ